MADEILESAEGTRISEDNVKQEEPIPDSDDKTMRNTKPGLKRLFLTLSVLFSFLIGFPFLWKSVEIYRSPLPFDDIDKLSTELQSNPILFPCQFQAIFVNFDEANPYTLQSSILDEMNELSSQKQSLLCGTCSANEYNVSVRVESSQHYHDVVRAVDLGDDEGIDEALKLVLGVGKKVYSLVVVNGGDGEGMRAVVGKYRHAWIVGKGLKEEEVVPIIAEIFVDVFVNGGKEEEETIQPGFMPVGADGRIVLSFNLLNADPNDWVYDW